MQLKYPLCCHCSWVIDAFHFVYQQDGDKEFYSFFHPSFHPLHPMASNPAHVQGMISPQEGRGGARWSCNRAGGGFSYSTDAAGSWSKMALGGPLNLIEISDQWKKMKHNKWNFKGYPPSEISFIKGWWCNQLQGCGRPQVQQPVVQIHHPHEPWMPCGSSYQGATQWLCW